MTPIHPVSTVITAFPSFASYDSMAKEYSKYYTGLFRTAKLAVIIIKFSFYIMLVYMIELRMVHAIKLLNFCFL